VTVSVDELRERIGRTESRIERLSPTPMSALAATLDRDDLEARGLGVTDRQDIVSGGVETCAVVRSKLSRFARLPRCSVRRRSMYVGAHSGAVEL